MSTVILVEQAQLSAIKNIKTAGLYLLQSQADLSLYRLGETKNLSSRAGSHGSSAPRSAWKKAPNWTEIYRPWRLLWAASIPEATHLSLKMCEHHLHAVFARRYEFVDDSGFEAHPEDGPDLVKIANSEFVALEEIALRQRRQKFDKEAHYRAQWLPKA
ncbi:hypothetical protein [Sphingomonas sp. NIBR02145]|uniref:hypothetical protein n=1 Tax=Sphingomonas sp. NIBR02145 TaxID=3014784 RepID=UPI0022B2D3AB|nr:hypothetical protein [Sphingomonas sp. NIBR02145]WHU03671.1 hypothetical protein O3305_03445 [Sphingomonas sp. NIBR02145]